MTERVLITEQGETLLGTKSPTELAMRLEEFIEFSGLAPDELIVSYYATIPIPRYPASWDEGRRRWAGLKPEAMWHPLFWLPPRLASRYRFEDESGEEIIETDDEYAARVALEVIATGLYDETNGVWQDILSVEGIDIDDPDNISRVRRWLDGGSDAGLDIIDLTDDFDFADDPNWAASAVYTAMPSIQTGSWAIISADYIEILEMVREEITDPDDLYRALQGLLFSSLDALRGVLDHEFMVDQWGQALDDWDGSLDSARSIATKAIADLTVVRDRYWEILDSYAEMYEAELGKHIEPQSSVDESDWSDDGPATDVDESDWTESEDVVTTDDWGDESHEAVSEDDWAETSSHSKK